MNVAIIGGGIGGLSAALFLKLIFPTWTIQLYEGMGRFGGRIYTAMAKDSDGSTTFESGAGRIGLDHKYTMMLLKRYDLDKKLFPITNKIDIKKGGIKNKEASHGPKKSTQSPTKTLENLVNKRIPKSEMETSTIAELAEKYMPYEAPVIKYNFEYDSEIRVARASTAIKTILDIFRDKRGFAVLGGGLTQLVDNLCEELKRLGVVLNTNHKIVNITPIPTKGRYRLTMNVQSGKSRTRIQRTVDKVIITTNIHTIRQLMDPLISPPKFRMLYGENILTTQPLLRVYARFPGTPESCWFAGLPKTATRMGIRYFIPIDTTKCLAMISYTDSLVAKAWKEVTDNFGEEAATEMIIEQLREIFLDKKIPKPKWVRYEYWTNGAHYWMPGRTPIEGDIEYQRMKPMERGRDREGKTGIYVGGEATSPEYQAWVEGGVERSVKIVETIYEEERRRD
jgi:protoporphyrinogen oxidase